MAQTASIVVTNPLRVTVLPLAKAALPIAISNPSGDPFRGSIRAVRSQGLSFQSASMPLEFASGATETSTGLPLQRPPQASYELSLEIDDSEGHTVLAVPSSRFVRFDDFSRYWADAQPLEYDWIPEGAEGSSEGAATVALPPGGAPFPGMGALKLSYHLHAAQASLRLALKDPALAPIAGRPKALGLWLYGDHSGVLPYVHFADSTGQVFREGGGAIDWQGWRYVLVYIDMPRGSHTGGTNDGLIHYPIRWDSLFLIENPFPLETQGTLYISGPTLVYSQ